MTYPINSNKPKVNHDIPDLMFSQFSMLILYTFSTLTVCPRSLDPLLYSKILNKMSKDFLDTV